MHCKGVLLDGQPCPNEALENGFCAAHQRQAADFLIRNLTVLQQELALLEVQNGGQNGAQNTEELQAKIQELKQKKKLYMTQCQDMELCRNAIRELAMETELTVSPDGVQRGSARLQEAQMNLRNLSETGMDHNVDNFVIAQNQESTNLQTGNALQAELARLHAESEQRRAEAKIAMAELEQSLKVNRQEKEKNEAVQRQLENALSNEKAHSATVTGAFVEENAKLYDQLEVLKQEHKALQARELELDASLREWDRSDQVLQTQIRELHEAYERKIADLQDDYAAQVNKGAHILSRREEELFRELKTVESALSGSVTELELANAKTKQAQEYLQSSDCGNLAQELISVNERLKYANANFMRLQQERDALVTGRAQMEVRFRDRMREGQAVMTKEKDELNRKYTLNLQEIQAKHKELTELQNTYNAFRQRAENEASHLKIQLQQVQFELGKFRANQTQQQQMLQDKERMLEAQSRAKQTQQDFDFQARADALKRQYEAAQRQIAEQRQTLKSEQDQQVREIRATQSRLSTQEGLLKERQTKLDENEALYYSKMQLYQQQQEELNAAIAQARQRGDQLRNAEQDFKMRLDEVRRAAAVDREQFQREKDILVKQLTETRGALSRVQSSMMECATARDNLLLKASQLGIENTRLKDQFSQLRAQFENSRSQYTLAIEQVRNDANRMRTNLADAAKQLDQIPAIHAHNKELESKMRQYQRQAEQSAAETARVQMDIQKVLAERQYAANRVGELQKALMACDASKKFLETAQLANGEQLRDLRNMNNEVVSLAERNADGFQSLIAEERRDAKFQEAKQQRLLREQEMKLQHEHQTSRQKTQQLMQLAKQREDMARAMADQQLVTAREIESLVDPFQPEAMHSQGHSQFA